MTTKLLLVEDSLSIQTIVETTFVQAGFEVILAGDALDGLHKAQTLRPDIVLADASMLGLDGFQLCQRIRHSASGRHVPVVLLTSGFAAYDKARGDRAGVTTHLAKPFEPHVLLALVQQLVSGIRQPASAPTAGATALPRPDGDAGEEAEPRPLDHEESGIHSAARLVPERGEPVGLPRSREPERAVELPGSAWNESAPAADAPPLHEAISGGAGSTTSAHHDLYGALGQQLTQMLREALDAHLATTMAQLLPQLLDTMRDAVQAQMPDLLEALLQREIAKLKQAVEQDQPSA